MSDLPLAPDPVHLAAAARLRETADLLRRTAGEVAQCTEDLRFFDREHDVWRGARATEVREGLREQQRRLLGETEGVVARLTDAARRIERRAGALLLEAEGRSIDDPWWYVPTAGQR